MATNSIRECAKVNFCDSLAEDDRGNEGEIGEAAYLDQAVDAYPMHSHAASWW